MAEVPPRARVVRVAELGLYAQKANRVTVRHRHGQVVAFIEIISPGNKGAASEVRAFVTRVADLVRQGVHALVVDLFSPTPRDPFGLARAIWGEFQDEDLDATPDQPLTLPSYAAGAAVTAYVEPVAVGDTLPDMPLFLSPSVYVPVHLEATYQTSWAAFPAPLRGLLDSAPG